MSLGWSARKQALLLMVVAASLWSIAGVLTRHLHAARSFEITFWRSLFAALWVAGMMWRQYGRAMLVRLRMMGGPGLISGCMWATMYSCFMISLSLTTVANTSTMESLAPLFTAILAAVVLKEAIPARTWWAILAAAIGMGWMFAGNLSAVDQRGLAGMLIALWIPLASSVNMVVLRKRANTVDLIPAVFLGGSISALAMLPLAWPLQTSLHDIAILAVLGFFQLGLPCALMVKASRSLSATEVALLALLEVLLAPIWAWLGAGEVPQQATVVGGVIVLISLIFNELSQLKKTA